jgi:hypothetical protein
VLTLNFTAGELWSAILTSMALVRHLRLRTNLSRGCRRDRTFPSP